MTDELFEALTLEDHRKLVKEITISVGCKINTGNYENVDYHGSIKMEIPEKVNLDEAYKYGWNYVRDQVREQAKITKEKLNGK